MRLFLKQVNLLTLPILLSSTAIAFPNMIRHGYSTCMTCHFSPSGGGMLTSYGKFVAAELYGTFNNSDSVLPWIVKPKEDAIFMGAFLARGAQTYFNTPTVVRGILQKMQADVELGVKYKNYVGMVTAGPYLDSAPEGKYKETLFVRRFYVGKQSEKYSVRAGKFFPEYGIYLPNHNAPTRKGLFFNHNQEPYMLQASYWAANADYTLGYISPPEGTTYAGQHGVSATYAYRKEAFRAGYSSLYMSGDGLKSTGNSVFATYGFSNLGYVLGELAHKGLKNAREIWNNSILSYLETGYEVRKGVIPYFAFEYNKNTGTDVYKISPVVGTQFAPFTHTEFVFNASWDHYNSGTGFSWNLMGNLYF